MTQGVRRDAGSRCGRALAGALGLAIWAASAAAGGAEPWTIVAIGASNTSGWGVGEAKAYPARLESMLRGCGHDVRVINAGIPFETTRGMLARIDSAVPDGTRGVVIQPGGNDLRFFGTAEARAERIARMRERLRIRSIPAIVYDPVFAPEHYQWDRIHITEAGHERAARDLLPQVVAVLTAAGPPARRPRTATAGPIPAGCGPAR